MPLIRSSSNGILLGSSVWRDCRVRIVCTPPCRPSSKRPSTHWEHVLSSQFFNSFPDFYLTSNFSCQTALTGGSLRASSNAFQSKSFELELPENRTSLTVQVVQLVQSDLYYCMELTEFSRFVSLFPTAQQLALLRPALWVLPLSSTLTLTLSLKERNPAQFKNWNLNSPNQKVLFSSLL